MTTSLKAFREVGFRKAFKFAWSTLFLVFFKFLFFPHLRSGALRIIGVKMGKNVIIHDVAFFNCYRTGFGGLTIGNDCFIGDDALIDLADEVVLENQVTLAERVTVLTHTNVGYADHPLQPYFPSFSKPVKFESGSFVGANATILPGVTIGGCACIAAGSVVKTSVAPYTVVGGVPARIIRTLPDMHPDSK